MKYKIAICDDCEKESKHVENIVREWAKRCDATIDVTRFPSAEAFLFRYAEERDFDILLLDVEMDGISGIELAKTLRQEGARSEIIFITSHYEFYGKAMR